MINNHHNHDYAGGSPNFPLAVGDRYYAQDLGRDFWYMIDKAGLSLKDSIWNKSTLVGQLDIRQKSSSDLMSIPSVTFYGNKTINIPDDYTSIPPSLETQKVGFIRGQATFKEFNIVPTATLDGSTINYIKIEYTDVDGNTRARAKASGSYAYEQFPSAVLTVDPVAPTDSEILLATLIGSGSGATWTILENKDLGRMDLPSYFCNTGVGDYRRLSSDHQADKEIMKKQVSFGTKFDELNHNRFFNHNLHQIEVGVESPEVTLIGGGWAIVNDSNAGQGALAQTSSAGNSVEFSFFGVHVSVNYEADDSFQSRNTEIEIKEKGGVFIKTNLMSNPDSSLAINAIRRGIIAKDLPLGEYTVKLTSKTTDELSIASFSYGTYVIQNPSTNYFLNGQWVRSVNTGSDQITSDREHNLTTNDEIHFLFSHVAGGIVSVTAGTIYFVIVISPTVFEIETSIGAGTLDIGTLTNHVYWIGDVCANRVTSVDDIPHGETFWASASQHQDANGGHINSGLSTWNDVASAMSAVNGFVEYNFIGNKIWVILSVERDSDIDLTFTIDGSTSNLRVSNPINFDTSQTAYTRVPFILRIDNGTLKHGKHTVKIVTTNFAGTGHEVSLSGWMHYSSVIYNDILPADVDFANNKLLLTAHEFNNDELVVLSTNGIAPTGLTMDTEVFIVNTGADDLQVSLTKSGSAIAFTDIGQGLLNIIKVRSTTEQSYIMGEDTDLFPAKDTRITYTGTWIGVSNSRASWRSQRNTTTTINSKGSITTPTADVRAVYHLHFHASETIELKTTLAGGNIKWFTNRLEVNTSNINGIRCLYDKVIDGDLSNKVIDVELMINPSGNYVSDGFIVEIGNPTNNESMWVMQKWCPITADPNEQEQVTSVHRIEVYGSKTDNRSGTVHEILTPWRSANATFADHVPFAEAVHSMNPQAVQVATAPYDSRAGTPTVLAGLSLTTGLFTVGTNASVVGFGRVVYKPSKVM